MKADPHIISRLKKEILKLHDFDLKKKHSRFIDLGSLNLAFPQQRFPAGVIHEFLYDNEESFSASSGFISTILSAFMNNNGVGVWINSSKNIFPVALKSYGIDAAKIFFIDIKNEKQKIWVIEEAMKCEGLSGVVADLKDLDFTISRRFQLCLEKSNATAFILRPTPKFLNTTSSVTRWRISCLPSEPDYEMPGVGFSKWHVELLKVRNGKPGTWDIEWRDGKFQFISKDFVADQWLEKTG